MKQLFEQPEIQVATFQAEDIITTSGGFSGSGSDSDDSEFGA